MDQSFISISAAKHVELSDRASQLWDLVTMCVLDIVILFVCNCAANKCEKYK